MALPNYSFKIDFENWVTKGENYLRQSAFRTIRGGVVADGFLFKPGAEFLFRGYHCIRRICGWLKSLSFFCLRSIDFL